LPNSAPLTNGTYKPSSYGSVVFPASAPPAPYASALAYLNGINPNGTWSLYVYDSSSGDSGAIGGGWTLNVATAVPVTPLADLAVGIAASPSSLVVGDLLTYTVTVSNLGPSSADGVVLVDTLPAQFSLVSSTPSQGTILPSGAWSVGTLGSSATANITLAGRPTVGGALVNKATVTANATDLLMANNTAQITTLVYGRPTLTAAVSGGLLHLTAAGARPGFAYDIQASANLALSNAWTSIGSTNAGFDGTFHYIDTSSPSFSTRYYRVRQLP
jgi:uncharacterized repeat protein (TIGR01451 family)